MPPKRLGPREMVGIAFACAAVAVPAGSLARGELAEHWVWAATPGALWTVLALVWVATIGIAADAARRVDVNDGYLA